jgi:ATP-dependent RNA helicase SUPV3L1/SUV3
MSEASEANPSTAKASEAHPLDALTGGAFSAPTSGERASRVRDWLARNPSAEQIQEVFKDLSLRDKGAARPLRERLDELKRAKGQEAIGAEWAEKAQALLAAPKLNIADAMAWQRDAAKAGAPLSREPLSALKAQMADRMKTIEDLQHRVQVQREAAVLLSQRIDVLSTKPWRDAEGVIDTLRSDVSHWQDQAAALAGDPSWASVEARFPPLLETSKTQLLVVWDAFQGALAQASAAAADAAAPLPPVQVWADEITVARGGVPVSAAADAAAAGATGAAPAAGAQGGRLPRPKADPAIREKAEAAVRASLAKLEQETSEGHGKASVGAAAALRAVLKEHGRHVDDALEAQVSTALKAAGELEGWQRWRSDQLREELVAKAEGLTKRPEGQALGGRKMQETLRTLRDQWKQTDQGGPANHALWKRFDEACNEAHKVVEAWLEKIKADAAEHRAQRLALIEELKTWAASLAGTSDLKAVSRGLHQFADRWRDAGHLGEKAFAEIQPLWKTAFTAAAEPLEAAQKQSLERRHAMIEEAVVLGAAPMLRIDAVKALQQRWQAEAQSVPIDRRQEQKLWDAFRKPIDEAFNRKTAEREGTGAALSNHDRVVLEASKALEAANASGDAQAIRAAMAALEAALRGQAAAVAAAGKPTPADAPAAPAGDAPAAGAGDAAAAPAADAAPQEGGEAPAEGEAAAPVEAPAPAAPPKPAPRPVVAVRGDDRPGMKKAEPMVPGRGGKFGPRRDGPPGAGGFGGRDGGRGGPGGRPDDRGGRFGDRPAYEDRGPRLGDAAFRAQREAIEHAQAALRKLAVQAHGEALTQLLSAWEQRDAAQLPGTQELGGRVAPAVRSGWAQALAAQPAGNASEALLRLEMAAEVPTPADHLDERRAMQLKLLTRRNDPAPAQTWGQDAAKVLATASDANSARRLQNALKALLRG